MHIGLVGLGRMGSNMRTRLQQHDITVTGYDTNPDVTDVSSLGDLVKALPTPRIVWVMVPAGDITHSVIKELVGLMA
ncbi:MAG: 6-phosphogluconate dehydrogenase, partial [Salinibacterium sp.]|nr:6-phosphogluconate dehydrogenase [Salinibacterium sp.]